MGQKFASLAYGNCRDYMFLMFYSCDKSILRRNSILVTEKFLFLVLPRNVIMLHLIIQFTPYCLSHGCFWEVDNKRCQTFRKKWSRSLTGVCLQEVPNIGI